MDVNMQVDEFVVGGRGESKVGRSYESKMGKAIIAIQLTGGGKVKRAYATKLNDFSEESLQYIFVNHVSREAKITTDK